MEVRTHASKESPQNENLYSYLIMYVRTSPFFLYVYIILYLFLSFFLVSPLVCCDRRFAAAAALSPYLFPLLSPHLFAHAIGVLFAAASGSSPQQRHDFHTFKSQWKHFKNEGPLGTKRGGPLIYIYGS